MRIVTDGKRFAIARRRWIFTQFYNFRLKEWDYRWEGFHKVFPDHYWNDYEYIKSLMEKTKKEFIYYDA